jgi:hypothetical protein
LSRNKRFLDGMVVAGQILLCSYGDEEGEEYHPMFNGSLHPQLNGNVLRRYAAELNRTEAAKVREFFGRKGLGKAEGDQAAASMSGGIASSPAAVLEEQ